MAPPSPINAATALLLHFDGPNGSTSFVDSSLSPKTITNTIGTASLSTAQSKFGGSSWNVSAGNNGVFAPSAGITAGTGDFTIEAWFYFTGLAPVTCFFGQENGTATAHRFFVGSNNADDSALSFYYEGSIAHTSASGALTTGAWHHIAMSRNSGTSHIYVDGALVLSFADTNNYDSALPWAFGAGATAGNGITGYIDEFRLVIGIGLYPVAFTPPTAAFTTSIGGTPGPGPVSGAHPLTINFADTSTPAPTAWNWDFGDGNTSALQNPAHTYTSAGTYSVTLTATIHGIPVPFTRTAVVVAS